MEKLEMKNNQVVHMKDQAPKNMTGSTKVRSAYLKSAFVAALAVGVFSSCDKGGSSFSVLSDTSNFQQSAVYVPRKLDVLFVVDNSGSMSTSQSNLANNFPSFINRFITKGYDFKLAITTTDAFYGDQFVTTSCSLCNVNQTRFRSGVTPNPVYVISSHNYDLGLQSERDRLTAEFSLNVKVGINGSGDERAFSSFKAALNSSLNAGFHRPDAYLAVVIVSDEEDFSQDNYGINESYTNPALHPVVNYKTFLDGFTGGKPKSDYSVSTISVLDNACRLSLNSGQKISNRYMQLADLTGGTKNSICSAFDTTLDNISSTIEGQVQPVFQLNKKPMISSIRVIVDGVLVPQDTAHVNGWDYDAVTNRITIYGSTYKPQNGSNVVINFDPDLNQ